MPGGYKPMSIGQSFGPGGFLGQFMKKKFGFGGGPKPFGGGPMPPTGSVGGGVGMPMPVDNPISTAGMPPSQGGGMFSSPPGMPAPMPEVSSTGGGQVGSALDPSMMVAPPIGMGSPPIGMGSPPIGMGSPPIAGTPPSQGGPMFGDMPQEGGAFSPGGNPAAGMTTAGISAGAPGGAPGTPSANNPVMNQLKMGRNY